MLPGQLDGIKPNPEFFGLDWPPGAICIEWVVCKMPGVLNHGSHSLLGACVKVRRSALVEGAILAF
jgi:hypothetical protein